MTLNQTGSVDFNSDGGTAQFLTRPSGYTVLNSGDEPYEHSFDGNIRFIPERGKVVPPHPKYPDDPTVCHSAYYRDTDELIPGTLLILDVRAPVDALGGSPLIYSAELSVKQLVGWQENGTLSSTAFKRGLSILGPEPTREEVAKADRAGRERWKQFVMARALQTRRDWEAKNDKRRSQGREPLPLTQAIVEADEIVSAMQGGIRKKVIETFDIQGLDKAPNLQMSTSGELDEDEIKEYIAANPHILQDRKLRSALSENVQVRKRKVPKSKQKERARLAAPGPRKNAAKIQVPVD